MDVRHNNNALQEINDCIRGLLHLGLNVITFRTLLHLGANVITFRTLLHLGQLLHIGLQYAVSGGEINSRRGMSCLRTFISFSLAFEFGRCRTTLSKFIRYIDLTDFCQISPKHFRNYDKRKCVGKF